MRQRNEPHSIQMQTRYRLHKLWLHIVPQDLLTVNNNLHNMVELEATNRKSNDSFISLIELLLRAFFANDCHVSMKFHAHHRQVAATKLGRPFSEALKGEDPSCHLMAKKDVFPGIFLGLDLKGYEARCIPATHVSHLR